MESMQRRQFIVGSLAVSAGALLPVTIPEWTHARPHARMQARGHKLRVTRRVVHRFRDVASLVGPYTESAAFRQRVTQDAPEVIAARFYRGLALREVSPAEVASLADIGRYYGWKRAALNLMQSSEFRAPRWPLGIKKVPQGPRQRSRHIAVGLQRAAQVQRCWYAFFGRLPNQLELGQTVEWLAEIGTVRQLETVVPLVSETVPSASSGEGGMPMFGKGGGLAVAVDLPVWVNESGQQIRSTTPPPGSGWAILSDPTGPFAPISTTAVAEPTVFSVGDTSLPAASVALGDSSLPASLEEAIVATTVDETVSDTTEPSTSGPTMDEAIAAIAAAISQAVNIEFSQGWVIAVALAGALTLAESGALVAAVGLMAIAEGIATGTIAVSIAGGFVTLTGLAMIAIGVLAGYITLAYIPPTRPSDPPGPAPSPPGGDPTGTPTSAPPSDPAPAPGVAPPGTTMDLTLTVTPTEADPAPAEAPTDPSPTPSDPTPSDPGTASPSDSGPAAGPGPTSGESGGTSGATGPSGDTSSGDGGGGGGGGGGGKIICTELYRQGLLDEATYRADQAFGATMDPLVMRGYHLWAPTVVRLMRRSRVVTMAVAAVARPWAREMACRMGVRADGSLVGAWLMAAGIPLCRALGGFTTHNEGAPGRG